MDSCGAPLTFAVMLFLGQHGFEALLERELMADGLTVAEVGPGWARAEPLPGDAVPRSIDELCFPHLTLIATREIRGDSVNALAQQIAEHLLETMRGERVEAAWPCVFLEAAEVPGLGRRTSGVEKAVQELLGKKLRRVAKLATPELPRGPGPVRGLFVFFADFGRAFISREAWRGGQRRMADDPLAPSRSYLKVEEAYVVLGREPAAGETVCDLGAAPGGWSYSAARRGARVVAIDNGPLAETAMATGLIEHLRADGFSWQPPRMLDWMVCDMVEQPRRVASRMAEWFANGWCRRAIFNLKLPMKKRWQETRLCLDLFEQQAGRPLTVLAKQLYHDREEITVYAG